MWLTIDSDLQKTVYKILEKNMRDILLSKMTDKVTSFEITEETDGTEECDLFYEMYDSAVADWWDGLSYSVKVLIYERETRSASV